MTEKLQKHTNNKLPMAALSVVFIVVIASCSSMKENQSDHLIIKAQGAFSAGGTVVKSDGTFNPLKPWHEQQGGQTRHGDHASVFYQIPANAKKIPWSFCMVMDNPGVVGKQLPMEGKGFQICSYEKGTAFTW
jgi:hypothetical protein